MLQKLWEKPEVWGYLLYLKKAIFAGKLYDSMLQKTLGIVLHLIPYNDKVAVAHLYTREYGRTSFLFPQGNGRKARMYRPLFMPFSILELDIDYRNTREIQKIVEARTALPLQNIYTDPVKNAETLFLAEMLGQTLKEPEPNPQLFAFVAQAIQVLNLIDEGKANFHLCFLLQLCGFLGFSPNMESYRPGYCFDMLNGIFTSSRPLHAYVLDAREAEIFARLTRMDFNNLRYFRFNRGERNAVLDRIITYYRLHQPGIDELRSPQILRVLFD